MLNMDLVNGWTWANSISTTGSTASVNGSSLDCRDCGKELCAIFKTGPNNPGDDTTVDWKIQESADDSTFTDITGATGTQVGGDATGFEQIMTYSRAQRYVRIVATLGGTSEAVDLTGILLAKKSGY